MKTIIAFLFLIALAPSLPADQPTDDSVYKARIQAISKVAASATRNVSTLKQSLDDAVKLNKEQDAELVKVNKQIFELAKFALKAVDDRDVALKKLELAQRTNWSFALVGFGGGIFVGLIVRKAVTKAKPEEPVTKAATEAKAPAKKPVARKPRK